MSVPVTSAVSAVMAMLDANQWQYEFDQNKLIFTLKFSLSKTKLSSVEIKIRIRKTRTDPAHAELISSYGFVSLRADKESMQNIAEYLTRANYGLNIGNFEMDFDDGEIRYKVALSCLDELPSFEALDDLCCAPTAMFDRYGNGLLTVALGVMSPEDAIALAES